MSTPVVVAIVIVLMLLGLGVVINQLLRLRKYLGEAPPGANADEPPHDLPQ
ncbi:hypothetical protein [Mycobacterium tilburgii]|uniref:hypothetical protein n=1 Tax=Mycobacterium tilburgii TaxID=44467 RepID=UPI0016436903|nr:hypothetical protein [Mycobacterium tilburgii]